MNTYAMIISLLAIGVLALYLYWLFNLTQSKKKMKKVWFYALLIMPTLTLWVLKDTVFSFMSNSAILAALTIGLLATYFIFWAETLWMVGGDDRKVWFVLIFLISPLWIVYRVGELA